MGTLNATQVYVSTQEVGFALVFCVMRRTLERIRAAAVVTIRGLLSLAAAFVGLYVLWIGALWLSPQLGIRPQPCATTVPPSCASSSDLSWLVVFGGLLCGVPALMAIGGGIAMWFARR